MPLSVAPRRQRWSRPATSVDARSGCGRPARSCRRPVL